MLSIEACHPNCFRIIKLLSNCGLFPFNYSVGYFHVIIQRNCHLSGAGMPLYLSQCRLARDLRIMQRAYNE